MKERPILFSAPMVRALLAGTKTQTRRPVKLPTTKAVQHGGTYFAATMPDRELFRELASRKQHLVRCPYGEPGDHLWVRETWGEYRERTEVERAQTQAAWDSVVAGADMVDAALRIPAGTGARRAVYAADFDAATRAEMAPWRPSIHMPRWASRITLEITDVRVQRLQDISGDDCIAEGVDPAQDDTARDEDARNRAAYASLWESINGAGSWDANPWVWAITFRRVACAT